MAVKHIKLKYYVEPTKRILEYIRSRYEDYLDRSAGKKNDARIHSEFLMTEKIGSNDQYVNELIHAVFNVPLVCVSKMTFKDLKNLFEKNWDGPTHNEEPEILLKRVN
ncbi:hypothetical protein [Bacillus altitudinis]|uniref:hypothetical protein n=1 Tax=Bacillus altitudinis TaxID=293387 RepID=UPI0025A14F9F|nr:hypothetical protein [Bacillus altitudinis]MDM5163842.1 hypothetical protein [Bacillus altitudinis]